MNKFTAKISEHASEQLFALKAIAGLKTSSQAFEYAIQVAHQTVIAVLKQEEEKRNAAAAAAATEGAAAAEETK